MSRAVVESSSIDRQPPNAGLFVGRRWWFGPLVLASVQLACYLVLDGFIDFEEEHWLTWPVLMMVIVGSPTMGAILIAPGCRWRHVVVAIGMQPILACLLLWELGVNEWADLVIVSILLFTNLLFQAAWIRLARIPRWIVRPSLRRSRNGVSMIWIFLVVTLLAIGFAVIRSLDDPGQVLETLIVFGGATLATFAGNGLAAIRHDRPRRIALLAFAAIGATLYYCFDRDYVVFSISLQKFAELDQEDLTMAVFLFPTISMVTAYAIHRSMSRLETT